MVGNSKMAIGPGLSKNHSLARQQRASRTNISAKARNPQMESVGDFLPLNGHSKAWCRSREFRTSCAPTADRRIKGGWTESFCAILSFQKNF
jgi:hypothetical protein